MGTAAFGCPFLLIVGIRNFLRLRSIFPSSKLICPKQFHGEHARLGSRGRLSPRESSSEVVFGDRRLFTGLVLTRNPSQRLGLNHSVPRPSLPVIFNGVVADPGRQ